jgi:predicted Rdx family selenoprotein
MLSSLMLAALVAASPSPTGQASAPPLIYHAVVSPGCTTLRNVILPIGYVTKRNDAAFRAMSQHLQSFVNQANILGTSTVEDNDQLLYGPKQTLEVATIDDITGQIFHNLSVEDALMTQSWREYPQGSDPAVDALRQRVQNLIDLQRALVGTYRQFTGMFQGNNDMPAKLMDPQKLRQSILALDLALNGTPSIGQLRDLTDASSVAKYGDVSQIVNQFGKEQDAFAHEVISQYNTCQGTNIRFSSPSPDVAPTPSP